MISKHIRNPDAKAAKHRRIIKLVEYILNPETENATEKCVYHGARGFITAERSMQLGEMIALSEDATRSKNTVEHFVLSLREGEKPTPEQVEEMITIWLRELGLSGCQIFYGLHEDTDNYHLHIAVNRMHPERLECIKINGGFTMEAEHRAIALIEHAQGWKS
ncbi:relaxase/mobilization nuclease domain-containing protein, partial [Klebsiella oxytoca]